MTIRILITDGEEVGAPFGHQEHRRDQHCFHVAAADPQAIFERIDIPIGNRKRTVGKPQIQRIRGGEINAQAGFARDGADGATNVEGFTGFRIGP